MKKNTSLQPDDPTEKQDAELGIISILVISLFIGLVAGAAAGAAHILPVAGIIAAIIYFNRKKIGSLPAEQRAILDSSDDSSPPDSFYIWPAHGQFALSVATASHQNTIRQLMRGGDNTQQTGTGMRLLKAQLVPESDNPYDVNAVRIEIEDRAIGYLTREQAQGFRQRLSANALTDQITTCNAIIVDKSTQGAQQQCYDVKLDIEAL